MCAVCLAAAGRDVKLGGWRDSEPGNNVTLASPLEPSVTVGPMVARIVTLGCDDAPSVTLSAWWRGSRKGSRET